VLRDQAHNDWNMVSKISKHCEADARTCIEFDYHIGASCELDNIKHCNPKAKTYRELSYAIKNMQALQSQCTPVTGASYDIGHWLYTFDNITHCTPKAETYRELSYAIKNTQALRSQCTPVTGASYHIGPTSGDCLLSLNGDSGCSLSLQGPVPLHLHGRKEPAETASSSEKSHIFWAPVGAQDGMHK
jgi:hypothetical protein